MFSEEEAEPEHDPDEYVPNKEEEYEEESESDFDEDSEEDTTYKKPKRVMKPAKRQRR